MAAVALGPLLQKQGDLAGAKAAYQLAMDSSNPDIVKEGQEHLQNLDGQDSRLLRAQEKDCAMHRLCSQ
jgi:hypothetical protein